MSEFSEKITAARKNRGLSQETAAELLCVSRQAIAKWENGKSYPSTENLLAVSRLYGISVDELCPPSISEQKNKNKIRSAGLLSVISAAIAFSTVAAAMLTYKVGFETALLCFIIAIPMQLFVHLFFRSCIENEDFSGIAGFDDKIEYDISAVKSYLSGLDFFLGFVCVSYTGMIALSGLFGKAYAMITFFAAFILSYITSILFWSAKFSRKLYIHEEDYLRAKRCSVSSYIFVAFILASVAEIIVVFKLRGIENNSRQAIAAVCVAIPAWAAAIGGLLSEQHRISKGGSEIFGKAFIFCFAAAVLLFAALPFAVLL